MELAVWRVSHLRGVAFDESDVDSKLVMNLIQKHYPQALLAAGLFDEDPTHGLGGCREEVPAVIKLLVPDQAQVSLVHQGRGLTHVPRPLVRHVTLRNAVQFLVDERYERFERGLVAVPPVDKQLRDVSRGHDRGPPAKDN